MDHAFGGTSLYIEVKEHTQAVDVFVRGVDQPNQVVVRPKNITTKYNNSGTETTYRLPVNIDPHTVHSVSQHIDEGISMKFRLGNTDDNTTIKRMMATSIKRYGNEVCHLERGPSQCGCRMCGLSFFKSDVRFSRVLPLPSQTWTDMLSMWNCCSHNHTNEKKCGDTKKSKNGINPIKKIQPREGDCLIGDIFIVVHSKVMDKNNIYFKKTKNKTNSWEIKCARCKALIGESDQKPQDKVAAYKVYKSCVEIATAALKTNSPSETIVRPIFYSEFFLERILAQQFANSSITHVTHMLIIQDPTKNVHLLVRVLNDSTSLYMVSGIRPFLTNNCCFEASLKPVPRKLLKGSKSGKDNNSNTQVHACAGGDASISDEPSLSDAVLLPNNSCSKALTVDKLFSFSNHYYQIARDYCDKGSECNEGEKIVKVLYACTGRESTKKLFEKWRKDERALVLTYPAEICLQIALVLMANTLTMPIANRSLDDMAVGYLRSE